MSNTRKAESGKPFRQERFSSSVEFQRGLLANLVARRCDALESDEDRKLVWFLQYLSHQPGGLTPVVASLLGQSAHRIGTASMRKFGCRIGQIYDADKVRDVRCELPWRNRSEVNRADIKRAIEESVIPSDSALAKAMEPPQKASGRRSVNRALIGHLPPSNDRSGERSQPILADDQSDETTGKNRLELHRESGALAPG